MVPALDKGLQCPRAQGASSGDMMGSRQLESGVGPSTSV